MFKNIIAIWCHKFYVWNTSRIQRKCLLGEWRGSSDLPTVYFSAFSTALITTFALATLTWHWHPQTLAVFSLFNPFPSTWNSPFCVFQEIATYPLQFVSGIDSFKKIFLIAYSQASWLYVSIHSFTQQAFIEHLQCTSHCARSRGTVVKRKVASCPQGS